MTGINCGEKGKIFRLVKGHVLYQIIYTGADPSWWGGVQILKYALLPQPHSAHTLHEINGE